MSSERERVVKEREDYEQKLLRTVIDIISVQIK